LAKELDFLWEVSHNCPKYGAWHTLVQTLPLYEAARARGVEVTLDNDAHTDYGASLWEALPQWVYQRGKEQAITIISDVRNGQGRLGSLSNCVETATRWYKAQEHLSPINLYIP